MNDNKDCVFEAYITNLGKYKDGQVVGKWHKFPTTKKEIQRTFWDIGIDGKRYAEYFITEYKSSDGDIHGYLSEHASIDELNYLASNLENMTSREIDIYEAAIESGEHCGDLTELINLTDNIDCYGLAEDTHDDEDLGYYWIEESGDYDTTNMGELSHYIDYKSLGRDIRRKEGGKFTTNGYICNNGGSFNRVYDGTNVPEEYRVFDFPERKRDRGR